MDHTRQQNSPQQPAFLHLHSAAQLQPGRYGIDIDLLSQDSQYAALQT